MATKVKARRLRPAGIGKQFVSIVHRGAARRVFKVLKGDGEEYPDGPCDGTTCEHPQCEGKKKGKAMAQKGDLQMLERLLARKMTIEGMIVDQERKCVGAFEAVLAQKGTTSAAVHSMLFDEAAFTETQAFAWAEARGFTVQKSEVIDGSRQLRVHPLDPGDREFVPVQVAKGVDAICFATPPDDAFGPVSEALKADIADMLDSTRETLLASIHTATPDVVRKLCSEVAAEIVTKMGGAVEEGTDDMLTQAELAKKVEDLDTAVKALPTAEVVADIVRKAMQNTPDPKAERGKGEACQDGPEKDGPMKTMKADLETGFTAALATATKAIQQSIADVKTELAAGIDKAQKAADGITSEFEKSQKALGERNGRVPERTRTVEGEVARKGGGMFDSVMPWGRRAQA